VSLTAPNSNLTENPKAANIGGKLKHWQTPHFTSPNYNHIYNLNSTFSTLGSNYDKTTLANSMNSDLIFRDHNVR
jgi:hypothetical protein